MARMIGLFVSANGGGRGCSMEDFLPPWVPRERDLKGPPTEDEIRAAFAGWE